MPSEESKPSLFQRIVGTKTVVAFWILGLSNNYGYTVMLGAAHDILSDFDKEDKATNPAFKRECNTLSTGVLLLADICPTTFVKLIAPFLPFHIFIRMGIAVFLSALGFLLVALRISKLIIICGICSVSFSMGLGETSMLGYMAFFKTVNVLSAWSSGTGGAGIFGSSSYAVLIAIGLSPVTTILVMLVVPLMEGIAFFIMIDHPKIDKDAEEETGNIPTQTDVLTFKQKLQILPRLSIVYMTPFGLVYLFEYFINQGLFELLYFPDAWMDHHSQYRWYYVLYQVGVMTSRSSMNLYHIDRIWLLAILQFINVLICLSEVFIGYITFLIILMIIIVWEGLVAGAAYVHTYRKIVTETTIDKRQFCMAMNSIAGSFFTMLAGIIAQPVHNELCKVPPQYPYKLENKNI